MSKQNDPPIIIGGAISDPLSKRALEHAELYYEEIRHSKTDIEKISQNTGYTKDQILLVKNYLFYHEHNLDGKIQRFDASFQIAQSWQRLAFNPQNIEKHDLTLIQHELAEMQLVAEGKTQHEAHIIASKQFNYAKQSAAFYNKADTPNKSQNSGAISYRTH